MSYLGYLNVGIRIFGASVLAASFAPWTGCNADATLGGASDKKSGTDKTDHPADGGSTASGTDTASGSANTAPPPVASTPATASGSASGSSSEDQALPPGVVAGIYLLVCEPTDALRDLVKASSDDVVYGCFLQIDGKKAEDRKISDIEIKLEGGDVLVPKLVLVAGEVNASVAFVVASTQKVVGFTADHVDLQGGDERPVKTLAEVQEEAAAPAPEPAPAPDDGSGSAPAPAPAPEPSPTPGVDLSVPVDIVEFQSSTGNDQFRYVARLPDFAAVKKQLCDLGFKPTEVRFQALPPIPCSDINCVSGTDIVGVFSIVANGKHRYVLKSGAASLLGGGSLTESQDSTFESLLFRIAAARPSGMHNADHLFTRDSDDGMYVRPLGTTSGLFTALGWPKSTESKDEPSCDQD